jgi:prepilin-type N-terminal cleavage/methylation domain-containing protein
MRARRGFTLTELLIVVGILLLLATISLAVFQTGRSSDRMRSAARVAQSAFLGAKDRAMHAKTLRGIRLTRDTAGPTFANGLPCLVTGFVYLQPIDHDSYPAGSIQLERFDLDGDNSADSPDITVVRGASSGALAVDWNRVSPFFATPGQIRIPATTGQWYNFTNGPSGTLILSSPFNDNGSANLTPAVIARPFTGGNAVAGCDIQFGNEVLPFHQPIALPAGVVIDLRYCSSGVQFLAGASLSAGSVPPYIDVSFSPRGNLSGAVGGLGSLSFVLRDLGDATQGLDPSNQACQGECLILTLNPSTGLVATYPVDTADANQDGFADNLFSFVQAGKAAGR